MYLEQKLCIAEVERLNYLQLVPSLFPMIQGHGLLHLYPSCWAFGLCNFALLSYFNWSHTYTHKIIKLEGHGKREREQHATHSFSVISYIFDFFFFWNSYHSRKPFIKRGFLRLIQYFITVFNNSVMLHFQHKTGWRIQCDLRNQISQVKHALWGTKNQTAILNKIEYSELCF